MPAIRTIHASEFNVDGYIYRLAISSNIIAESSHSPTPVLSADSDLISSVDTTTGIYRSIHQSSFGILLERALSLQSVINPISDVAIAVGIELPLISSNIRCGFDSRTGINTVVISSGIICSSGITARYVVPNVKTIQFGTLEFQSAERVSDDSISVISDEKYALHAIDEPLAYTRKITIRAETNKRLEHDTLLSLIGQKLPLWVYGLYYPNSAITNISDLHVKPKLTRFVYTVEFTQYVYNTSDSVTFAGMSLSNPTLPNAMDISPEYSIEMSDSFNASPIPVINRRFAVECITESESEYESLASLIGTKQTLIINGKTYPLCYISILSGLQPRGGGNVWKYTVEFSKKSGEIPVNVTFNGISLPDAVASSEEELEILSSRTTLHSGAIVADIGSVIANRFSFTCMANNKVTYNQLKALIGSKYTLVVDGEPYTKCYISSWSSARRIGTGSVRLYTWSIGFEQETA